MKGPAQEIIDFLRERLPDIPLHVAAEGGPWRAGVNVYRLERTDLPSRSRPYAGTAVAVMYDVNTEVESGEWRKQVQAALLPAFGDRFRPMETIGSALLFEDPDTQYSRLRAQEYEKRRRLGWVPLHELGK